MSFENISEEIGFAQHSILNDDNDLKHRFFDPHPFVPADDEKGVNAAVRFFNSGSRSCKAY